MLCLFYIYIYLLLLSVLLLVDLERGVRRYVSGEGREDRVRLPGYLTDPDHIQNTENCIHSIRGNHSVNSNIKMRHRILHTQNFT